VLEGRLLSDIFISYARSTEAEARRIAEALSGLGYGVWRDDELPANRTYGEVIEERLHAAKAVVVVWSAEAAKSQWVRAEADLAREAGKLVQLTLDGAIPPLPFNQIHCADLTGWSGDLESPGWRKLVSSVNDLVAQVGRVAPQPTAPARQTSVCVLPFVNMSGDPEQEYFSDGVSEDIITDLSKVSALSVVARNTAFSFKGKNVEVPKLARQLGVSHFLEGSVRKAGGRVRVTAQLINGVVGDHVWAERYDRDLTDIFALHDEISKAVLSALKLKLLPKEKKAIERRGTTNAEAYELYLMARQFTVMQSDRHLPIIIRLCRAAIESDPGYARAWAQLALSQLLLGMRTGSFGDARECAGQALRLDPALAEAHAANASWLFHHGRREDAVAASIAALACNPDCVDALEWAAWSSLALGRFADAITYYERAFALEPASFHFMGMAMSAYQALSDTEGARSAAQRCLAGVEKVIAAEPDHGTALGHGVSALAMLGEVERARAWARRAVLLDPENINLHYNMACAMVRLGDVDAALDLLERRVPTSASAAQWMEADPDLAPIRDHPRFQALVSAARQRAAETDF